MLISVILGVLVGAVLGLTGAGGGILAVPALVFGLGWSMQQAAPVALIAVAAGAALGAVDGLRAGLVRYRAAAVISVSGIAVTSLGVLVAQAVSQRVLLALFAVVMVVVAIRLLRRVFDRRSPGADPRDPPCQLDAITGRFVWNLPTAGLLIGVGALTGFTTGLLGVGGGFVIVPLLRRLTGLTMHSIVATSLLVIAIVGVGGVGTALLHGATMPWLPTLLFTAATALGMLGGRIASRRLTASHVQIGFAAVLLIVAVGLLVKAARAA